MRKILTLAVFTALCEMSCARAPSEAVIKQLITLDRSNCVFQVIQINDIGPYDKSGKYWPVRVRLKGACDQGAHTVAVDTVEEYKFYEESGGFWRFRP
ncbi:MAG: hypothetical protein JRI36_01845 [Deltaproteobacteria bacterium]|nr:hypothetical protein [Deltaproteobacteria bacterium]